MQVTTLSSALDLNVKLQPKQVEAMEALGNDSPANVVGYGGSKGSGKSFLIRAWQVIRRLKYPNTSGVIIRKTFPELLTNHIKRMWIEYPGLHEYYKTSEKVLEFPNGSHLYFRHLQTPDDVYNFQGSEYEDISIDEATQHPEETFTILRTSNRTTSSLIKPKMLLTFNPGGIGHMWVKRMFIDREFYPNENPDDYAFVQAYIADNPALLKNDPGYLDRLKALPENKRRAYLEGDWNAFEGQFFTSWRADKHIKTPPFELNNIPSSFIPYLAWDEGVRAPRAAYLLIQDNDGIVHVVYEYYRAGELAAEAAYKIRSDLEELGCYQFVRDHGLFVYDPSMDIRSNQTGSATSDLVTNILDMQKLPGNNNRAEGFRRFQEYLSHTTYSDPLLRVSPACQNLIRTLPQQIYADGKEDINTDGEDHAVDAVRYGLMAITKLPPRLGGMEEVVSYRHVKPAYMPMGRR